jgi:CRISPR-associated protein Csx17
MDPITFTGVSTRSLGDLLKGYGLIAVLGEKHPEARFWWDEGFHLVAELTGSSQTQVEDALSGLPKWGEDIGEQFKKGARKKSCDEPLSPHPKDSRLHVCSIHGEVKPKPKKKGCPVVLQAAEDSPLKSTDAHDAFDPFTAELARAAAVPRGGDRNPEPHPWFPGYGQESSGNYFAKLAEISRLASKAPSDLSWCLFGIGEQGVKKPLDKGYLFFPEPTTRYATGVANWEREKAAVTSWCFLLVLRGALLLRGTLRRPRWRRVGSPAFPFVFDGGDISEVHLPTWNESHPRTLNELLMQVRGFNVPLAQGSFAVTAAEFRAAIQQRGPGTGFDTFHRFVFEARRPGQQQRMPQAIPRGLTRVRGEHREVDLRRMIAPLGSRGWIDQFLLPGGKDDDDRVLSLQTRRLLDNAIHRAVDEPSTDAYLQILDSLWELSRRLLLSGKLRRAFEKKNRTPRPPPLLPVPSWEQALRDGLASNAAWRVARAIGSISSARGDADRTVGPILEQLLPVRYQWDRNAFVLAEDQGGATPEWSGRLPLHDFQSLLWHRWLASEGVKRLPFAGKRTAPLDDVLRLIRGELDLHEVHRLVPFFALLDWPNAELGDVHPSTTEKTHLPIPASYAALRLWFELGIRPDPEERPPGDGVIPRALSLGGGAHLERAIGRALARLRIQGLPWWDDEPAPTRKAVATLSARLPIEEAERMALAVMVPISRADTLALSRRLWVATIEKEMSA